MFKKLVVAFAVLALAIAFAGTVPGGKTTFKITLMQPSVVNGTELKAGDCRLSLGDAKITLVQGKQSVVVAAKIEDATQKFDTTMIRYKTEGQKQIISEIRLGGTTTRIVVTP
jgi:hypothetical protein